MFNFFNKKKNDGIINKCKNLVKEYPQILYKGIPVVIVAWWTIPVITFACTWAPWIYLSHKAYTAQKSTIKIKSWWNWFTYYLKGE